MRGRKEKASESGGTTPCAGKENKAAGKRGAGWGQKGPLARPCRPGDTGSSGREGPCVDHEHRATEREESAHADHYHEKDLQKMRLAEKNKTNKDREIKQIQEGEKKLERNKGQNKERELGYSASMEGYKAVNGGAGTRKAELGYSDSMEGYRAVNGGDTTARVVKRHHERQDRDDGEPKEERFEGHDDASPIIAAENTSPGPTKESSVNEKVRRKQEYKEKTPQSKKTKKRKRAITDRKVKVIVATRREQEHEEQKEEIMQSDIDEEPPDLLSDSSEFESSEDDSESSEDAEYEHRDKTGPVEARNKRNATAIIRNASNQHCPLKHVESSKNEKVVSNIKRQARKAKATGPCGKTTTSETQNIDAAVEALGKYVPSNTTDGTKTESKLPKQLTRGQLFKALVIRAQGGLLEQQGMEILQTINGSLINRTRRTFKDRVSVRTQRNAVHLIAVLATRHFETIGKGAIYLLLETMVDYFDESRIYNACQAALMSTYAENPLVAATYVADAIDEIASKDRAGGANLIDSIRSWHLKAHDYMQRVGLKREEWANLAQGVVKRLTKGIKLPRDVLNEAKGFALWKEPIAPDISGTGTVLRRKTRTGALKHVSWNSNGLRARWIAGDLMNLITDLQPDTLHIGEIKTSTDSLTAPAELRELLAMHGYKYMIFYWCTKPKKDAGGANSGNFGTALFSKVRVRDVQLGIGCTEIDQEGRVITGTIGGDTMIWTYNPCSPMDKGGRRAGFRKKFDAYFRAHYRKISETRGGHVNIVGDLNVAPSEQDINIECKMLFGEYPSTYPAERLRHQELLTSQDLCDAYTSLNTTNQNEEHLSWVGKTPPPERHRIAMRLDHLLVPRNNMDSILSCKFATKAYGSDHRALVFIQQHDDGQKDGTLFVDDNEEQPSRFIPEKLKDKRSLRRALSTAERSVLEEVFTNVGNPTKWKKEPLNGEDPGAYSKRMINCLRAELQIERQAERTDKPNLRKGRHKLTAFKASSTLPMIDLLVANVVAAIGVEICTLVDSGASTSFLTLEMARQLDLIITPCTETVTIGDSHTVKMIGTATIRLQFGNHATRAEISIMKHLPYDFILGCDTIKKHKGRVSLRDNQLELIVNNNDVNIPFKGSRGTRATKIRATREIDMEPGQERYIEARCDVTSNHEVSLLEANRWGIVHNSRPNADLQVAKGILRLEETGTRLQVRCVNVSDVTIKIKTGDAIAEFDTKAIDMHALLTAREEKADGKPTTEQPSYSKQKLEAMTGEELDVVIRTLPHLRDLNLANNEQFTVEGLNALKRIVLQFHTVWSLEPKPVSAGQVECDIQLKPGVTFNNVGHVIPSNPSTQKELRKIIEDQLTRNIIEPSTAPNSSTVLLVPKPHGGIRFCVDYRMLNSKIKGDAYTLPTVQDQLASLSNKKIFSSVDLKEAFWNVPLTKDSRELTAFRTQQGLYQYQRMPMGLKTASATFCRFIDKVVGDLKWESVLVYIDDLLIATETEEQHLDVFAKLIKRLDDANLTLGAKKCFLGKKSVRFLGHVVSEEGLAPDPDKVKAIEAIRLPTTGTEMAAAIGLMGYYRKFVLNYSKIEAPLRNMRRASHRWKGTVQYTEEERTAFTTLRDALTTSPILAHPDWSVPFELHTDASHKGLGAVLCQRIDNKEHVIAYASRAVAKTEAPWATWELEALAMVWAVRHFKMYLYNTHFTIKTDSEAARQLIAADDKAAGGRLLRWRLALQEFEYTVVHRKGTANANADALSRMFLESDDPYDEVQRLWCPNLALICFSLAMGAARSSKIGGKENGPNTKLSKTQIPHGGDTSIQRGPHIATTYAAWTNQNTSREAITTPGLARNG